MASTNKTQYYNLSQYIGTDKPTYLVDYNTDMSNIDTGIHGAKAESEGNTAKIGTLANLTTTDKTDLVSAINEVDGNADAIAERVTTAEANILSNTADIGDLDNLTTTDKSSLVGATNENASAINNLMNKIGVMTIRDYSDGTNLVVENGSLTSNTMSLAYSSDMSLYKLYGFIRITKTAGANCKVRFKLPTGMSALAESDYTIRGSVARANSVNSEVLSFQNTYFDKTNNEIYYETGVSNDTALYVFFLPCLYFNQVFNAE